MIKDNIDKIKNSNQSSFELVRKYDIFNTFQIIGFGLIGSSISYLISYYYVLHDGAIIDSIGLGIFSFFIGIIMVFNLGSGKK